MEILYAILGAALFFAGYLAGKDARKLNSELNGTGSRPKIFKKKIEPAQIISRTEEEEAELEEKLSKRPEETHEEIFERSKRA